MVGDDLLEFYRRISDARILCLTVGSVASIAFGEPRATLDIDLVVAFVPGDVERLIAAFPEERFYLPPREVIQRESERRRGTFNIIDSETGLKADIYPLVDDPLSEYGMEHAMTCTLGALDVMVGSPTYLIAAKLRYYAMSHQEKHLRDIRGMVRLSGHLIDHAVVDHWAREAGVEAEWRDCQARPGAE